MQLDPQLIFAAIQGGACDEYLDQVQDQIILRRRILTADKVSKLQPGTQLYLTRIRPKYLDGVLVEVTQVNVREDKIHGKVVYGGTGRWPNGSTIIFGAACVGEIK